MRRRFIADTWSPASGHPTHAALTGDQAAHLARVLRAQSGQIYDIVANGFLHRAEITSVSEAEIRFTLHEELEADPAPPIHLLLAVFKFDHFEWAVEKATELGVARITPILARRTEKHLAHASAKRVDRWRRIALEAAKQSRRTDIPEISDPTPLAAALAAETAPTRILLSETEQDLTLSSALARTSTDARVPHRSQSEGWGEGVRVPHPSQTNGWDVQTPLALAIGPEGGWAPDEMSLFSTHQWTHVTLGPRILRAETAAIAALAISSAALHQPTK
ncbi:MAG TPA: RsmE family RNA methyltransferase [Acidobacteriaceae bacterium]|jgi:16S rRNA (uracil1498-N3)-methyltransferase|nr:RsmE family RNA methyltransferase [Acidobacteriaceae bacterium]